MFLLPLQMVGCSHESSEAAQVGRMRRSPAEVTVLLETLRARGVPAVLLSTCHRTELYWWGEDDLAPWFEREVLGRHASSLRVDRCEADLAVRHLFAVTAGMRSMRFGEPEIQQQVRAAWQLASAAGASHAMLDLVFRRALEASRHIRHAIGGDADPALGTRVCATITTRCTALAEQPLQVLLVGAGDAAQGVLHALRQVRADGALHAAVRITSRTDASAVRLAASHGAEPVPWASRDAAIAAADLVVFAVQASVPLVDADAAAAIMAQRSAPALWLDLGVPPNVASDVLPPAVEWIGLDTLAPRSQADAQRARRATAALQRELARLAADMHRRHLGARLPALEARATSLARATLAAQPGDHDAGALARQVMRLLLREFTALSA